MELLNKSAVLIRKPIFNLLLTFYIFFTAIYIVLRLKIVLSNLCRSVGLQSCIRQEILSWHTEEPNVAKQFGKFLLINIYYIFIYICILYVYICTVFSDLIQAPKVICFSFVCLLSIFRYPNKVYMTGNS